MIDRRGFFAFAFKAAAGAACVLVAAPAMAQGAPEAPNHRRNARTGGPRPQHEASAAQAGEAVAPNHRRGRQKQAQAPKPEVVADLEPAAQPQFLDPAPRRSRR